MPHVKAGIWISYIYYAMYNMQMLLYPARLCRLLWFGVLWDAGNEVASAVAARCHKYVQDSSN